MSPIDRAAFDDVVAHYIDRLASGERLEPEQVLATHPEVGPAILEELRVYLELERVDDPSAEEPLGTIGDYTLRRQIGRGGMGVVYEAWQGSLDRPVALKVLPAGVAADSKAFVRFMREAKTAAQLHHPHVVSVYGMGVEQNTPYYSMEYIEGETLAEILARAMPAEAGAMTPFGAKNEGGYFLSVARACAEVADGLQHAHSKGVIHRDIKPSNLILERSREAGQAKLRILDFGLARLEGQQSLTLTGDFIGTPAYMSPEQARRRQIPVDHRTDIYSLGATLYELITQEPPFHGRDHAETLSQIIDRDPRPPRQVNSRVPTDLETVVLKCLHKDAGERYGTAEAVAQDLRRFVRGEPVEARPQPRWQRTLRRLRRHRVRLAVLAVAVLLAVAIGWLDLERRREERARNLAAYEPAVREAVLKIFSGRLSLEAARGESRGLTSFGAQDLITEADFKGLIEIEGGRPVEEAARELEVLAVSVPNKADALFHLARSYSLLERSAEALEAVGRALERSPAFVPAQVLALELSDMKRKERHTAIEAIAQEHSASDSWERWWLVAQKNEREKRWPEAAAAYRELLRLRVSGSEPYVGFSIDTYMAQGLALLEARDYEGAQEAFIAARALSPGSLEPDLFLARVYYLDREPERADAIFADLYRHSAPERKPETALWITAAYNSLKDYARALESLEQVADERIATRLRIYFLLRLGRTEEAIALGRKTIAGGSRDPVAHYVFGLALFNDLMPRPNGEREQKLVAVVDVLKSALELKKDFPAARQLLVAAEGERRRTMERRNTALLTAFVLSAALGERVVGQEGFFDQATTLTLQGVNSAYPEAGPVISANRLELFFARFNDPEGEGGWDLWVATRARVEDPFGDARSIDELNTEFDDGTSGLSSDGLTLYFASNRPGIGDWDLWVAERNALGQPFAEPRLLDQLSTPGEDSFASVTADGLELYFARVSPSWDLFVATRTSTDQPFGDPTPLTELNTGGQEYRPVSADGLAIFYSGDGTNRPQGQGDHDIFMATRPRRTDASGNHVPFGAAINLGPMVNSAIVDFHPSISTDWPASGAQLYFSRGVFRQNFDIYVATWHPDCNRNGEDDSDDIANDRSLDDNSNDLPDECESFVRGESNDDQSVDIADAVHTLTWLFSGGPTPGCLAAVNSNGDATVDIADPVHLLSFLFQGGPAPKLPFPGCGLPTLDVDAALGCLAVPEACRS